MGLLVVQFSVVKSTEVLVGTWFAFLCLSFCFFWHLLYSHYLIWCLTLYR